MSYFNGERIDEPNEEDFRRQKRETCHQLKIWPEHLAAILHGTKKAEVRTNDRNFQVDDLLYLHEWRPVEKVYTGDIRVFRVTHINHVPDSDYVVLSIGEP